MCSMAERCSTGGILEGDSMSSQKRGASTKGSEGMLTCPNGAGREPSGQGRRGRQFPAVECSD